MNWLTDAGLLLFTLLMAFTGQLLRWDQTGFWSVVIAAEQAGRTPFIGNWLGHFILAGDTAGGATLSRFFAAHVFFIPALIFMFLGFYLYLVLHNGISEPPEAGQAVARAEADRQAILAGVIDGTLELLATDHAPHTGEDKSRGFIQAPFGMVGLETAVGVTFTLLVKSGLMNINDWLTRWRPCSCQL